VFGRIGNTEKARQNLERAVELARGSDQGETILALSALGRHLEIAEADVAGARAAFEEALALAEEVGVLPAQVELHASLAQLGSYAADWEQVEATTRASTELAEREGLVGKLSLPYTLQGLLRWREGRLEESAVLFQRANELADRVGWSELAFQALYGLACTLRDAGDLAAATAALDRAIDVCERAGLIAQSIQATGMRAVILALSHRREAAREAAEEASELAERLHYRVGSAAALEARGATATDRAEAASLLVEAAEAWSALDRPLEATRSRLLAGQLLLPADAERGRELLEAAATESEELGVGHLAARARTLAAR
jgi:tetratricopeptide (TPR) repeat protein